MPALPIMVTAVPEVVLPAPERFELKKTFDIVIRGAF